MKNIRIEFSEGKISKSEFIHLMYENFHKALFDYSELLKETDILNISISDDAVMMTTRQHQIQLMCPKDDWRSSPIEIFNFGSYENAFSEFLFKMCHSRQAIFDIGANIGYYSTHIAKLCPSSHVYSFEPIPRTFDYLQKNIALNNLTNVTSFPFGLSDKSGEFDFYYYKQGSGNASESNLSDRSDTEIIRCELETLDRVVQRLKTGIDIVKCDVEGAEYFVFRGGTNVIEEFKPIIFTEMLRKWTKSFSYHPNKIIELLESIDYQCFRVLGGKLIDVKEITEDTTETNFVFLNRKKHQSILDAFF